MHLCAARRAACAEADDNCALAALRYSCQQAATGQRTQASVPGMQQHCISSCEYLTEMQREYLVLLVEPPAPMAQLVGSKHLRLIPRHGVEDVEQRLLRKLGHMRRAQLGRVVAVVRRHLRTQQASTYMDVLAGPGISLSFDLLLSERSSVHTRGSRPQQTSWRRSQPLPQQLYV